MRKLRERLARVAGVAVGVPVAAQDGTADPRADPHAAARAEAVALWNKGQRAVAIETLRRANVSFGNDGKTWYLYGARLLEVGRGDAAFEAIKTAVDLEPLNLSSLELLLELCHNRQDSGRYVNSAISNLARHISSRPNLHRSALDYFIPARSVSGIDALRDSPDRVVRLAIDLNDAGIGTDLWEEILTDAEPGEARRAQLTCFLARGKQSDASKVLQAMEPSSIPAESVRVAIRRELRRGRNQAANRLLIQYLRARPEDAWGKRKFDETKSSVLVNYKLAQSGYPFPAERPVPEYEADHARIFYLLHNSLPYHSAGYATRTHGLLRALRNRGWDATGVTRLGYPFDMPGHDTTPEIPAVDVVDGVPYERISRTPGRELKHPIQAYVDRYSQVVIDKAAEERPFVLHGASNHWNGLTAVAVGRTLGVASIYEVRGLWEITRASRDPLWANSDLYQYMARMERDAAAGATAVIAITNALKAELVARGVPEEKITVVPNGVDTARFTPRPRNEQLAASLGLRDKKVIGYVGSILDYEGIDMLIEAVHLIARERNDFGLLLVGDGPELPRLQKQSSKLGLDAHVLFTGRVPHSEVEDYYSLIDIAPFPRLPLPVCEMVSPLKPMEAMAMGKAVVASNVAALSEMVQDGATGLLHQKGHVASLASSLARLLDDEPLRRRLASDARQWVEQERDWQRLALRVSRLYEVIGGVARSSKRAAHQSSTSPNPNPGESATSFRLQR